MWVKASGAWLADAGKDEIFVPVHLPETLAAMEAGNDQKAEWRSPAGRALRSSIETSLHAAIGHRWVVHLHTVHSMLCSALEGAPGILSGLLNPLPWAWVAYERPGLPLTEEVRKVLRTDQRIWVLGNHGLVVAGDTAAEAQHWLDEVESRWRREGLSALAVDQEALQRVCPAGYHPARYGDAHECALRPGSFRRACLGMPAPDFAVFLGMYLCPFSDRMEYAERFQHEAPVLLAEGLGAMVRDGVSDNGELMLEALGRMLARMGDSESLTYLPAMECEALLHWDAEKYRQAMTRP